MTAPTHTPWCERAALAAHAACYARVAELQVAENLRITIEINGPRQVAPLISVVIDRGPRRTLLPLGEKSAEQVGQALAEAVALIRSGDELHP